MQPVPKGIFFGSQAELDVLEAGLSYTADTIQFMSDIPPDDLASMMRQLDIIKADIETGRAFAVEIFGSAALRRLVGNNEVGATVRNPQAKVAARIIQTVVEVGNKMPAVRDDPLLLSTAAQMWDQYQLAVNTEPPQGPQE